MDNQSDSMNETPVGINDSDIPTIEVWEQRFAESDRLSRFFAKLLTEVVHIGADEVEFARDGDVLVGSIRKDRRSIKTLNVRAGWLSAMTQFLGERCLAIYGQSPPSAEEINKQPDLIFQSALAIDDRVAMFRVTKQIALSGKHRMILSHVEVVPRGRILDLMFGGAQSRDACEKLFHQLSGVTVIGAPDVHQVRLMTSSLSAISNISVIGDSNEPHVAGVMYALGKSRHVIVTTVARDITEVYLRLREMNLDPGECDVRGVLCNAFVPRSCEGCVKRAKIDPHILAGLPEYLGQLNTDQYAIGRGCDACGQTGFNGYVGIQGLLVGEDTIPEDVLRGTSESELVERFYSKGLRSLLEDGVRKALVGYTTIEAVFKVAKFVPEVYRDAWRARRATEERATPRAEVPATEPALDVSADFFVQKGEAPELRPTIARQLPGGAKDSAPLFETRTSAPKRERPLILIVEDDPDQRSIVELTLKGAEYDVIQAENGMNALEVLEKETPDLIVSDLMMPVMDGGELVMRCKSSPRLHKIPILMLTVVSDEEREYALLDMGADDYCEKTIQRKLLLKRIEKLLVRANSERAGQGAVVG